jgi:hypothetical protein
MDVCWVKRYPSKESSIQPILSLPVSFNRPSTVPDHLLHIRMKYLTLSSPLRSRYSRDLEVAVAVRYEKLLTSEPPGTLRAQPH